MERNHLHAGHVHSVTRFAVEVDVLEAEKETKSESSLSAPVFRRDQQAT